MFFLWKRLQVVFTGASGALPIPSTKMQGFWCTSNCTSNFFTGARTWGPAMPSLTELMEAARAKSAAAAGPPTSTAAAVRPGSVMRFLHSKPEPSSDWPEIPQPSVICGCSQCPNCGGTWIIESYGPNGKTVCFSCLSLRTESQSLLFDYSQPSLATQCAPGQSSPITVAQFIDIVTRAGYPQLAELVKKYNKNEGKKT